MRITQIFENLSKISFSTSDVRQYVTNLGGANFGFAKLSTALRSIPQRLAAIPATLARDAAQFAQRMKIAIVQRPSRTARRRWVEELEYIGPFEIRERMNDVAFVGTNPNSRCPVVDAGMIHGVNRFPTMRFVQDWLGDDAEEDNSAMRLALTGVVLMLGLIALTSDFDSLFMSDKVTQIQSTSQGD